MRNEAAEEKRLAKAKKTFQKNVEEYAKRQAAERDLVAQSFNVYTDILGEWSLEELSVNHNRLVKQVQEVIAKHPELTQPKISIELQSGYYGEKHLEVSVVGKRPMTEQELKAREKQEADNLAWQKRQYEELKKKFETTEKTK